MMNSQSKLTVERPGSFIGLLVVEICGAYFELNSSQTRSKRGTNVRVWKHLTRSLRFKSCVSITIEVRIPTTIESRISTTIESCVSSLLKFVSPLDQHDNHVYEGCVLSHIRNMSLLLQSVQQHTGKVTDNSTGSIVHQHKPEPITSARLSFYDICDDLS